PPNRGGLNSTHIHGTSGPVEEPSTASEADSCTATKPFARVSLPDPLVRGGEQRRRYGQAAATGDCGCLEALRSVCDLEHDLSRLVRRTIQHAVGGARVGEVENLADRQV